MASPQPPRRPSANDPDAPAKRVDCFACRFLRITHQAPYPYACELFGMRTSALPSLVVLRESGAPCRGFERKPGR